MPSRRTKSQATNEASSEVSAAPLAASMSEANTADLKELYRSASIDQEKAHTGARLRYLVSDELGNLFAIVSFLKSGESATDPAQSSTTRGRKRSAADGKLALPKSSSSNASFTGKIKAPFLRLSHRSAHKVSGKLGVRIVPVPGTWEGTGRSYVCPIDELDELCCRVDIDYASSFVPQPDRLVADDFSIRFDGDGPASPNLDAPLLSSKRSLVMPKPRQRQVLDELCAAVSELPRRLTHQLRKRSRASTLGSHTTEGSQIESFDYVTPTAMANFQRHLGVRLEAALREERLGKGKRRALPAAQVAYDVLRPDTSLALFKPYLVALQASKATSLLPLELHCIVDDILAHLPDLDHPITPAAPPNAASRRLSIEVKELEKRRNFMSCSLRSTSAKASRLQLSRHEHAALNHLGQLVHLERICRLVRKSLVDEFPDFKHDDKLKFLVVFVLSLVCYHYWQEAVDMPPTGKQEMLQVTSQDEDATLVARHLSGVTDELTTDGDVNESLVRARANTMPALLGPLAVREDDFVGNDTQIEDEADGWLAPQLPPFSGKTMNVAEAKYVTEQLLIRRRALSIGDLDSNAAVFGLKSIDMSASPAPVDRPPVAPETPTRQVSNRTVTKESKLSQPTAVLRRDLSNAAANGDLKPAHSFESTESIPLEFNFTTAPTTPSAGGLARKDSPTKSFGLERHPSRKLPSAIGAVTTADAGNGRAMPTSTPPQVGNNNARRVSLERRPSSRSMHPLLDPERVKPASATVAPATAFLAAGPSLWDHDQAPNLRLFGEDMLSNAKVAISAAAAKATTTPAAAAAAAVPIPVPGSWLSKEDREKHTQLAAAAANVNAGGLRMSPQSQLPIYRGRTVSEAAPLAVRTPSQGLLAGSAKAFGSLRA